jgi:hypothetical protein
MHLILSFSYSQSVLADSAQPASGAGAMADKLKALPIVRRSDRVCSKLLVYLAYTRDSCYARVGLMGNPSDGFFGKTISLSIANYWAEVTIAPSDR